MRSGLGTFFFVVLLWAAQAAGAGRIQGRVTDRESGRPLSGANVLLLGTSYGAVSDSTGKFHLEAVPAGTYRVRVSFVGYRTDVRTLVLPEGSPVEISVALDPLLVPGQEITVTATRGRERETPATFTTLSRQEVQERYTTQDIPVLLSALPSSTSYSESGNGIGYTYLNIRGFDSRRIAVMVNGIPQNDPEDHNVYWLDFPDLAGSLEDIQVERGAGSAFYGPPAIGGSVNLVTESFGSQRSAEVSAGTGSFNTRKYSVSFSSGLVGDRYAFHARLSKILSSGYRQKSWVDFSSYFLGLVRYDETMTTQLNFYGGPIADGLAYYGIPKADVGDRERRRENPIGRPEEMENFSQPHYELFHEWRLNPALRLNNTLFLVLGDGFFDYDGSWAPLSYYRITPAYGFAVNGNPDSVFLPDALIRAQVDNTQYGWLPRLTWKHEGGTLIAGAEMRIHRSVHWGRLQWSDLLPPDVPYDYRYYQYRGAKNILSLYVHELYEVQSGVTMMMDLQYAYNRYRLYDEKFLGNDFSVPYHFLNPRVGLNYNIDPVWNAYVSAAFTSREPRLTNLYDAAEASTPPSLGRVVPEFAVRPDGTYDFSRPLVKPESLFDLEFGTGMSTPEAKFAGNLYWMEFTDEIVPSGQVDRFGQPVTGNADRTRHIGLELSGSFSASGRWEMSANLTVSRNRFVRHTDYSLGVPLHLDGNPIAGFPDLLFNGRIVYHGAPLNLALAGRFVGRQYTDNFHDVQNTVDPYFVADGSISYLVADLAGGASLEAKLQVNNLFDTLYAAHGEGTQFFVGAERNVFLNLTLHL